MREKESVLAHRTTTTTTFSLMTSDNAYSSETEN